MTTQTNARVFIYDEDDGRLRETTVEDTLRHVMTWDVWYATLNAGNTASAKSLIVGNPNPGQDTENGSGFLKPYQLLTLTSGTMVGVPLGGNAMRAMTQADIIAILTQGGGLANVINSEATNMADNGDLGYGDVDVVQSSSYEAGAGIKSVFEGTSGTTATTVAIKGLGGDTGSSGTMSVTDNSTSLKVKYLQAESIMLGIGGAGDLVTTGAVTATEEFFMPFGMTITSVTGSLATASTGDAVSFDVLVGDVGSETSIFSAAPAMAATSVETRNSTAGTLTSGSGVAVSQHDRISIDLPASYNSGGAKGLKITINGVRT